MLGEDNLCAQNERYQLGWAGKSDAYRTLQSPTFNTLAPCIAESVDFHDTQNVFIEAENLEALKILQKSYAGKVKMIYIDPPYNTGSDSFVYPDKFAETREEYARRVGDKDQDGYLLRDGAFAGAWRKNSKDNGHYHSNWLSMMLPRLHLAKTLLREDGVIFISIDDNEQAQLKLLCDEVFGAENFVAEFAWEKKKKPSFLRTNLGSKFEYIICYSKNKFESGAFSVDFTTQGKKYPFNNAGNAAQDLIFPAGSVNFTSMPDGIVEPQDMSEGNIKTILKTQLVIKNGVNANDFILWGEWRYSQKTLKEIIDNKEKITISKIPFRPNHVKSGGEIKKIHDLLTMEHYSVGTNEDATDEQTKLLGTTCFSYAKPLNLIKFLIQAITHSNHHSLILDFFSGSGTTAHAVMALNTEFPERNLRYICVQLPEEINPNNSDDKAVQTAFQFCVDNKLPANIAEIAKERIRRAGAQIRRSGIHARQNMPSENIDTAADAVSGMNARPTVDTGFKVFKLTESHFKQWRRPLSGSLNEQQQLALLEEFQNIVHENAAIENMAYELMLRLGFELTDSIEFADNVVWLNNAAQTRKTALLLDTVNQAVLDDMRAREPKKVFVLDKACAGNDALKTNAALQFKDAGVDFETL